MNRAEAVLDGVDDPKAPETGALISIHRASLHYQSGARALAEADCLTGLKMVNAATRLDVEAEGLNLKGVLLVTGGNPEAAFEAFTSSLKLWTELDDRYQMARLQDQLAGISLMLCRFNDAEQFVRVRMTYWQQFPERMELPMSFINLGLIKHAQGEFTEAMTAQQNAIALTDQFSFEWLKLKARVNLVWPALELGRLDHAQKAIIEIASFKDSELNADRLEILRAEAAVLLASSDPDAALTQADIALLEADKAESAGDQAAAQRLRCDIFRALGKYVEAEVAWEHATAHAALAKDLFENYQLQLAALRLFQENGQTEKAQNAMATARNLATQMGIAGRNPEIDTPKEGTEQ